MTVAEYMVELDARSEWIGPRVEVQLDPVLTGGAMKLYEVLLLVQQKNGTYQGAKQPFYVLNEGVAGETVYPVNAERKSEAPNPFRDQLRAYADTQITETRPKITLDQVDEVGEFAIVTAYEVGVENKVAPVRYFVAKDALGNPYIRPYTG